MIPRSSGEWGPLRRSMIRARARLERCEDTLLTLARKCRSQDWQPRAFAVTARRRPASALTERVVSAPQKAREAMRPSEYAGSGGVAPSYSVDLRVPAVRVSAQAGALEAFASSTEKRGGGVRTAQLPTGVGRGDRRKRFRGWPPRRRWCWISMPRSRFVWRARSRLLTKNSLSDLRGTRLTRCGADGELFDIPRCARPRGASRGRDQSSSTNRAVVRGWR